MTDTPAVPSQAEGEKFLADIHAALAADQLGKAMDLAVRALADGWRTPLFFSLAAFRFEREGRFLEAADVLEKGLESYPNDLELLTALALCLDKSGQARRAVAAFDTVLQAMPDFAPAHHGKGLALERLADPEGAERHYRAAVDLMPGFADALASLAVFLARRGRHEEARSLAERALAVDPANTEAKLALAVSDLASGAPDKAEPVLRAVLDDPKAAAETRASAAAAFGDALDAQGRYADAFAAYEDANARLRAIRGAQSHVESETYMALAGRLTAWFTEAGEWRPDPGTDEMPAAGHAFIVSASARSGADRLHRALAAHPGAAVVERSDALAAAEQAFLMTPGGLARLATLGADEAKRHREAYWRRTAALAGDLKDKVVVDRAPLGAATLCLISALFPKAKIVLALRDPRDVVLRAFRRPALVNPDLHAFLSLDGAASLYDAAVRLLEASWERLPIEIAEMRLEDMAADPEAETRSLAAFIGIDWDEAMRRAAAEAPDARMGRSDDSRWRSYAAELAPVLPGLAPWVERFGYPEA